MRTQPPAHSPPPPTIFFRRLSTESQTSPRTTRSRWMRPPSSTSSSRLAPSGHLGGKRPRRRTTETRILTFEPAYPPTHPPTHPPTLECWRKAYRYYLPWRPAVPNVLPISQRLELFREIGATLRRSLLCLAVCSYSQYMLLRSTRYINSVFVELLSCS